MPKQRRKVTTKANISRGKRGKYVNHKTPEGQAKKIAAIVEFNNLQDNDRENAPTLIVFAASKGFKTKHCSHTVPGILRRGLNSRLLDKTDCWNFIQSKQFVHKQSSRIQLLILLLLLTNYGKSMVPSLKIIPQHATNLTSTSNQDVKNC